MADYDDGPGGGMDDMDAGDDPGALDEPGDEEGNEDDAPEDRMEILQDGEESMEGRARTVAERITTRYLTKYERARVLGTRALQISMNAPIMVDAGELTDPLEIAMKELREKRIPFTIRRYLPDGSYEDWSLKELIINDI
eukprot:GHUV01004137.1.p2 GENE.GHUV01004137.1~~GHUV01004137.1.p2  ORF type:complete len:140 (+),score=32.09 GHUV01004137.1:255-674(+)